MTNQHQDQATKIVAAFRDSLDDSIQQQISDSQFNTLTLMIQEAIGQELSASIERIETLLRQIRSEIQKPELAI